MVKNILNLLKIIINLINQYLFKHKEDKVPELNTVDNLQKTTVSELENKSIKHFSS